MNGGFQMGTDAQRMQALDKANAVRCYNAKRKRALTAGTTSLALVLEDPRCDAMRVADALMALPSVGHKKTRKALTMAGLPWGKTIGELTDRQRVVVAAAMADYGRRRIEVAA